MNLMNFEKNVEVMFFTALKLVERKTRLINDAYLNDKTFDECEPAELCILQ